MASRKKITNLKAKKKSKKQAKTPKPSRSKNSPRRSETGRPATSVPQAQPIWTIEPRQVEHYRVTIENIRGDTPIGDLLVAFPRTREILVKNGLRLEAEDAGDIYMNLDAFSAMNGLRIETLVQEIVQTAKEPVSQVPGIQLAAPTA